MENQPQSPDQQPGVTRPVPKKPFNIIWLMIVAIAIILFCGVAGIIANRNAKPITSSSLADKPQTVDQQSLLAYQQRQAEETKNLSEEQKNRVSNDPNRLEEQLGEAPGIPPETAAQQRAISGGQSGPSPREQKKAEYEKRREAAMASSSVALDLSKDQPAAVTPVAEVKPQSQEAAKVVPAPNAVVAYSFDNATGPSYRIFEGTIIEGVLTNRIAGAFAGPINVMVTTPVYSLNHQELLIPQGTRILGTVTAVNSTNQQRLFVAFHRAICPDGYSIDLDKFIGLDVVGQSGLKDKVNHHYAMIFGASLAVGAIGGIAQIGNSASGFGYDPSVALRNGISEQMGMESQQILDRFLNQLPTFVIRERCRVKVYISGDILLPAYNEHRMNPAL